MLTVHEDDRVRLIHGDCVEALASLPDASVDAVVTDPPYELGFMGRHWDASGIAYRVDLWSDVMRALKPGGHLLAFGGTRTWHRLACAIEDAGFEIRDSIAWMYGSGFPKSLDVSKAIDKAEGHWRGKRGDVASTNGAMAGPNYERTPKGDPVTAAAAAAAGWGTALKPAHEPIVVARKPLAGTVAANMLEHGTGALNIDGCRIAGGDTTTRHNSSSSYMTGRIGHVQPIQDEYITGSDMGRWPANVVLDEDQAAELDRQSGWQRDGVAVLGNRRQDYDASAYMIVDDRDGTRTYGGQGGASRFFYVAKAPTSERPRVDGVAHPTVKPLSLMRWLVRLVTPPNGVVLEPFAGSGTTVEACLVEGFRCIAIEREADYIPLILSRIEKPTQEVLPL